MYLPENDAQMFDILIDLRLYAQSTGLPRLAEEIDDALMVFAAERTRRAASCGAAPRAGDSR